MAHDISNPNQAILSSVTLLQRACPGLEAMLGDRRNEGGLLGGLDVEDFRSRLPGLLDAIADCSRRIDSIVKNLRAFSRDEPERPPEEVDVNAVVESALQLVTPAIRKATARFGVTLAPDLPRVRGNAQRLEQVVINLVLNACQALADRGKRITVATRRERESVILAVEDEGTGIPQDQIARVTEPFFTTRRSSGGTGLGLYLADSIVKEHGGELRFRSSPGVGTVAEAAFPPMPALSSRPWQPSLPGGAP
jgi:polar amino acid transport system substrate-binding protein